MAVTNLTPVEAQVVRLRNEGTEPFSQKYGGVRYVIQPNSETIVPYMAMCLWLGHPNAVDLDKKRRHRTQEFQRLCVKWGIYEHYEEADERFPKITAWDIITNEELITVVKDPDGKHLTPDVQTKLERDTLMQQMAQMQQQLAMLQAQADQNARENAAGLAAGDTRADNPTHRPEVQMGNGDASDRLTPVGNGTAGIGPLPDPDSDDQPPVDETGGATVDRPTPKPMAARR